MEKRREKNRKKRKKEKRKKEKIKKTNKRGGRERKRDEEQDTADTPWISSMKVVMDSAPAVKEQGRCEEQRREIER